MKNNAVVGYLLAHPGSTSREIAAALDRRVHVLQAELAEMHTAGRVRREGPHRERRYFLVVDPHRLADRVDLLVMAATPTNRDEAVAISRAIKQYIATGLAERELYGEAAQAVTDRLAKVLT